MKSGVILTAILLCICFGCKKDIFDEYGHFGVGTVEVNGEFRTGKLALIPDFRSCFPDTCISIGIDSFSSDGYPRLGYGIAGVPLTVGRHYLKSTDTLTTVAPCKFFLTLSDEDGGVIVAVYYSFEETPNNYIEITDYNPSTGDIKGTFEARLIQDSYLLIPPQTVTDTLHLKNGKFEGKVYWE